MEESEEGRYWCYQCSKMVNPILEEVEALTCPVCLTGFLELRESALESDDAAPSDLILAMLGNLLRLQRAAAFEGRGTHGDQNDQSRGRASALVRTLMTEALNLGMEDDRVVMNGHVEEIGNNIPGAVRGPPPEGGDDMDHDNEGENVPTVRFAVSILRTLRSIQMGTSTESSNPEGDNSEDGDNENDENNRSSAAAIIRLLQNQDDETRTELPNPNPDGSLTRTFVTDDEGTRGRNRSTRGNQQRQIGEFGDYFFGPNFDAIMELLTENDPNQYGTPPAQKDAVLGLPDVRVEDDPYPNGSSESCTVCLEGFRAGTVVKEMPCKHRFHSECILPWLDLHSSCPVCRHRLPAEEESKPEPAERDDGSRDDIISSSSSGSVTRGGGRLGWGPFLWPF